MKKLKKIFSPFQQQVAQRYLFRAHNLIEQLNSGESYNALGGCRLSKKKQFIRFKFGAYRLIFKSDGCVLSVHALIHRKNLDHFLNRRCS